MEHIAVANSPLEQSREFLKDTVRLSIDFSQTDQHRGLPPPPLEKPYPADARRIDLTPVGQWKNISATSVESAMRNRQSRRDFSRKAITLDELSFLLWATQGVRQRLDRSTALRTVPSAGARHALETYLAVLNVAGLETAFYRYLPLEHQLLLEFSDRQMKHRLIEATLGQTFIGAAAVVFIWTAIPYRMEWRYGLVSHKVIAIDVGHVCQNLYLACEAIQAGTCAVGAYHQQLIDELLRLDGKEEFVIYLAPVGKI
jgi:SagB-type dehydrogenase family enzyme